MAVEYILYIAVRMMNAHIKTLTHLESLPFRITIYI